MSPDPEQNSIHDISSFDLGDQEPLVTDYNSDEIKRDKEAKKALLLQVIQSHCNDSSEFADLRAIGKALQAGDELEALVISGGLTNYSYKVSLKGDQSLTLYAKIAFSHALWNPNKDIHYDVERAANEFKIIKHVQQLMGDEAPVATPYICADADDVKIFVTEWADADEQWGNQWIEGTVDARIIPKLARALATLNLAPLEGDFDVTFNANVLANLQSLDHVFKTNYRHKLSAENAKEDPCVAYFNEVGQDEIDNLIDDIFPRLYSEKECLNHSDCHCFNLLVERKPNVEKLDSFADNGDLVICDWEMARVGAFGADPGVFWSWPIACAVMHAAHGRRATANELVDHCVAFWEEYAGVLVAEGNKDDEFVRHVFRNAMGWAGKYLFLIFYLMDAFNDDLPNQDLTSELFVKGKGSLALVGLRFIEYAYTDNGSDLSLDELRKCFGDTISQSIEELIEASSAYQVPPRRASALRQSGRRVSDSALLTESVRKLALSGSIQERSSVSFALTE